MRYIILFILIFSITISSCQIKKTIINISPNLGNPLTISKDAHYCVETYNKSKKELLIKKMLGDKLKVLGINLESDCKYKLVIEIINISANNSKNIPVSFTYKKKTSTKKGNESNYTTRSREWNEYKTVAFKENLISILFYIDVYNKENILIDSVNSFSDISKREVNVIRNSSNITDYYKFRKTSDNNYPIYSSVNEINMNHILDLDDKILKSNDESGKVELLKIGMFFRDQKNYKINKEDILKKEFYTRRCKQTHGDNVEMMSIQQLYYFMATNSFDKWTSVNGIGYQAYHFWNSETNHINTVYFYSPACEEVTKVSRSGSTFTEIECKQNLSGVRDNTVKSRDDMPKQLYSQYFEPYKSYVYYWEKNQGSRIQNFYMMKYNVGENIFCASKEFKSPKLGAQIDLDDVQTSKAFTYIKINVE
jgi:hypothetical protein